MPTGANGDFRVINTKVIFVDHELSPPLVIGKGTITAITEASCCVTISDGTRIAHGFGTVLLSHVWCWPDATDRDKDFALREATKAIASALTDDHMLDHVLGHGFRLLSMADQLLAHLPPLARRVCCAPLDNAIHDAAGCLNDCSSFALFSDHRKTPFDTYFPGFGAVAAIDSMLRPTTGTIDAQMVVGITTAASAVSEYCTKFDIHRLKVKIGSGDITADVAHVTDVARAIPTKQGAPEITVDANGAYATPQLVLMFIDLLKMQAPDVLACVAAIEQPAMAPSTDDRMAWSEISFDIPILVDESFTGLDDLKQAGACGWNGLAIKSCRGQTLALLGAAWAYARGWRLMVMDLTSPNIAALHTVLLAGHVAGVTTAEVNAAQFLKSGYEGLPDIIKQSIVPSDGKLSIPAITSGLIPAPYRTTLIQQFEVA